MPSVYDLQFVMHYSSLLELVVEWFQGHGAYSYGFATLHLYFSYHSLVLEFNARNFVENFIEKESDSWICAFFWNEFAHQLVCC